MFAHLLPDRIDPSNLVLRVQPDEGISLQFQTKMPESRACLQPVLMDFKYREILLDAYERVLLDMHDGRPDALCKRGDRGTDLGLLTPVLERLDGMKGELNFPNYAAGSSGPKEAEELMSRDGRQWRPSLRLFNKKMPDEKPAEREDGKERHPSEMEVPENIQPTMFFCFGEDGVRGNSRSINRSIMSARGSCCVGIVGGCGLGLRE